MTTQIPLHRAKKIDSEDYAIGFLTKGIDGGFFIEIRTKEDGYHVWDIDEIDPATLSIHFPDMIAKDSNRLLPCGDKDLRIFASLSEDGKGGDILLNGDTLTPIIFKDGSLKTRKLDCLLPARYLTDWKIIGVQK